PQRGPAEPAAAPGRGDSVGADQLVDQVLETLLRAVARCALLSHGARVPPVPTNRRAGPPRGAGGGGRARAPRRGAARAGGGGAAGAGRPGIGRAGRGSSGPIG